MTGPALRVVVRNTAPTRPSFGTIRSMSSENTAKKMSVKGYLRRFASYPF